MHEIPQFILDRSLAREPIFTAEEVATWSDSLFDQLITDGVLKATDNAASVTCDACGHDHVEEVQYIQSPPGAELRAYISCPENGRVRVPLGWLRRWIVNKEELPVSPLRDSGIGGTDQEETAEVKRGMKKGAQDGVPKRSWTQPDLDEAIREYKAKRSSTFSDLVDGVKRRRPGATKSAREMFGRNAIARAFGVRSKAMVTNSPVWGGIADELGLRGRSSRTKPANGQRIGMDIALEKQAVGTSQPVMDQVIRRETVRLIQQTMPTAEEEATIEKLQRGDITDDAARALVEVFAQQQQDNRTHKVRQDP